MHEIVVVGASAGGIEALRTLVAELPSDFPATVLVVVHLRGGRESSLPEILARAGPLPASHARDREAIRPGRIFVAPPDTHLLVESGCVRLVRGPFENSSRPAIDPLFRSAALAYGSGVIGVILSGSLDDGASGMLAIKQCGGIGVVQDPDDAAFPTMPRASMEHVTAEHCVPLREIAPLLERLVREPAGPRGLLCDDRLQMEVSIAAMDVSPASLAPRLGEPSMFSCPDCGGVLWEQHDPDMMRYRCYVGHAFSPETLFECQSASITNALWVALRALEENATSAKRISVRMHDRNDERTALVFDERQQRMEHSAGVVRHLLCGNGSGPALDDDGPSK